MKKSMVKKAARFARSRSLTFGGSNRLIVVSCNYVMNSERGRGKLRFDIDPESVTFHLFEAMG